MASENHRRDTRAPITLKIKFKSASLDQFIERYSVDVSRGGIFIRTKEPLAVGTLLRFEFQLQDASSLIAGDGTVIWVREYDPNRTGVAPGMGVRFDKLQPASLQILEKILAEKSKRGETLTESRFDAGVRASSPAAKVVDAAPSDAAPSKGGALAEMPKIPAPPSAQRQMEANEFANEATRVAPAPETGLGQGIGEEFAAESTRVMQNDFVQRLANQTRDQARDLTSAAATGPSTKVAVDPEAHTRVTASFAQPVATPPPTFNHEARPATTEATRTDPIGPRQALTPTDLPGRSKPRQKSPPTALLIMAAAVCVTAGGYLYLNQSDPKLQEKLVAPAVLPITAPAATTPPEVSPASIQILSQPPGAQVVVNGTPLPSPTPTVFNGFDEAKVYELHLSKNGFHPWSTSLHLKTGEKVSAVLVPNEKEVEVSSTPTGAEVILDGKRLGRTPFTIQNLDLSKMHQLAVKQSGFIAETHYITSGDNFETKGDKDVLQVALILKADGKGVLGGVNRIQKRPLEPAGNGGAANSAPLQPTAQETVSQPPSEPEKIAETGSQGEKPAGEKEHIKVPNWMKPKPSQAPAEKVSE
jgi:uncharacterized protein (TIGR02266 family)